MLSQTKQWVKILVGFVSTTMGGSKPNLCFLTRGLRGTATHSHWCTIQRWHGRPSSHANLALMQLAQAFLIPLGIIWLEYNEQQ